MGGNEGAIDQAMVQRYAFWNNFENHPLFFKVLDWPWGLTFELEEYTFKDLELKCILYGKFKLN